MRAHPAIRQPIQGLVLALATALAPTQAATNLLANGGFETGDFTSWSGSAVSALNGVFCPAHPVAGDVAEGGCAAYFGAIGADATLQQTLTTLVGGQYLVRFAFQADGSQTSDFSALWAGQTLYSVVNPPAPASPGYTYFTFAVTATSVASTLSFNARNDLGFLYLDDVSVTAVPEPAAGVLLGLGLASLAGHSLRRRRALQGLASGVMVAGAVLLAPSAQARITKIAVTSTQSPTFGGYAWPGVGQYERLAGKAYGELDPSDPKNAVIVDLALAPRNAAGKVEYAFDFYLLKPIDLSKGNHKMLYEPPNRGGKTIAALNRGVGGNDPGSVTDPVLLANAFLMPQGYTMSFSGWDFAAGTNTANFNATITLPVARNGDGSSITGPGYEYIVSPGASYTLNYAAATLDQSAATLTHRVRLDDAPVVVPASGWAYNASGTAISLTSGSFIANDIYEFKYTAKDPTVNAVGLAAVRDWNAFLRYETVDDFGNANPMAGDITRIYTEISSQPGRLLNDFRYLGFNQAENGKIVLDGLMQWIAAGDGINLNYRWSQPGRTERNRQDHLYLEGRFPFANVVSTDPITGKTDGRLVKCQATNTCPLSVEIFSANEYWVKAASLMTTNPAGTADLPDSPFSRIYFMSSMQHGTGNAASKGSCQQFQNPLDSSPVQRALFTALDLWVTQGVLPPASRVPTLADGTFAPPLPQSGMGFPNIPGVTYTGLKTTRYLFDYGTGYYTTGIPTVYPPLVSAPYQDNPLNGPIYPSYVPRTDVDGNDIAGIRLQSVAVPLATYTGWALRSGAQANDGCESAGQFIPFAATQAARLATGDPRLSAVERYDSYGNYSLLVNKAVKRMIADRTLLPADAAAVVNDALTLGKTVLPLRNTTTNPTQATLP